MSVSLNKLAIAAMSGDADAWQDLYTAITPSLFAFLNSKFPGSESDEIVLLTWEKVFLKQNTFDPAYSFRAWVFTIAINTYRDRYRRTQNDLVSLGNLSPYAAVSMPRDSDDELQQQLNHLFMCLESLNSIERGIIRSRFWEQKTHVEIANAVGLRSSQIRSKCHRAVQKLTTCMRTCESEH